MGTSGNRDYQQASRSALKDFADDALTISAGSLFGAVKLLTQSLTLPGKQPILLAILT